MDGRAIDYVYGGYSWIYVNEYIKPDGTKDVWEDYADEEDSSGTFDSLTGTIEFKVNRSNYSYLKLRLWAELMDENGDYVFLWSDNELDPDRYSTGDQIVSFTITDAVPRGNVTCDFTLPATPLVYGQSYQVGYSVHGLDNAEDIDIDIYVNSYDKLTNIEPMFYSERTKSTELSGTITFNAEYGNYISVSVVPFWSEGGKYTYRSLESARMEITPLSLGTAGWITKNGKKYYGDSNGNALRGMRYVGDNTYFFDETGAVVTGWFTFDGKKAYADANGVVYAGYHGIWSDSEGNQEMHTTHIQEVDGELYWFNDNHTIETDKVVVNYGEGVYYLDKDGKAVTGWIEDEYGDKFYAGADKKLALGWATIDGKQYYFEPGNTDQASTEEWYMSTGYEGRMLTGVTSIDGKVYRFDDNGVLVGELNGFVPIQSAEDAVGTYQAQYVTLKLAENGKAAVSCSTPEGAWDDNTYIWKLENGRIYMQWTDMDGKVYPSCYFAMTSDGILIPISVEDASTPTRFWGAASLQGEDAEDGWTETENGWTYVEDGQAVTGWKQIGETWYYFDEASGIMATSWKNLGGMWYYFDDGAMAEDWKNLGGTWYYFDDGAMATGWIWDGAWYYFEDTGAMAMGWKYLDGAWYYFDESGAMASGWKSINGTWYYFDDGAMATGWRNLGGAWYYFVADGSMASGWMNFDGVWYYFRNGAMATGWVWDGAWYFFEDSGSMAMGWKYLDGAWYYFNSGAMVTGWQLIGGQWELFSDSGAWQQTWQGN